MRISSRADFLGNRCVGKKDIFLTTMKIRGSEAYNRKMYSDLMAMTMCLGPPTWFLTLSANDLAWPDLWNVIKSTHRLRKYQKRDMTTLPIRERNDVLNKHPVSAARHFMFRLRSFLRLVLLNDKGPLASTNGHIIDYFVRIEFQMRGSPHAHMLFWAENAPDFNTLEGIDYIGRFVTCALPTNADDRQFIKRLQTHKHSPSCFKKKKGVCRFQFPRPVSETTRILRDDEALRLKRTINLKRQKGEELINNYNPELLKIWRANIDISPVGTIPELVRYISDYMSKSETEGLDKQIEATIKSARQEGFRGRYNCLRKIGRLMENKRIVGVQEAIYLLLHLPLRLSSRKTVFLNTRPPDERTRLLRKESIIQHEENVALENSAVFPNIFDRYTSRPDA